MDRWSMPRRSSGPAVELYGCCCHRQSVWRLAVRNVCWWPRAISRTASLIESGLFGYERGAFTGATSRKLGRFELANGGTIFLDEIGDLPLESQVKLLRALQEGEIERLGGTKTIKIDVRIIAATNRNLKQEIE